MKVDCMGRDYTLLQKAGPDNEKAPINLAADRG
jgi:hypothetical protein